MGAAASYRQAGERAGLSGVQESLVGVAAALLTALVAAAVLLAFNYASAGLPRAPIRAAVQQGFAEGVLQDVGWLDLGARIGTHQFNDCLVLLMAADDRAPAAQRALSPNIAGVSVGDPDHEPTLPCPVLRQTAAGAPPPLGPGDAYHRYVHGDVAVIAALLPVFSIGALRQIFAGLAFCTPAVLAAACLWRLAQPRPAPVKTLSLAALWGALLATAFGPQFFGPSLAHFPADILLPLFLAGAVLGRRRLQGLAATGAYNALFGALTVYFELLMGGLPLGGCLVLTLAAAQALDAPDRPALPRIAVAALGYAIGAVTLYAVKLAVTALAFDAPVAGAAAARLSTWTHGDPLTVLAALAYNLRTIGGGSLWLGALGAYAGLFGLFVSLRRMTARPVDRNPAHWALVLAALAIPLWWWALPRHTTLHAWAMVRMTVGLEAAGLYLFALLHGPAITAALQRLIGRWSAPGAPNAQP